MKRLLARIWAGMQVPLGAEPDERRRHLLYGGLITLAGAGVLGAVITTAAILFAGPGSVSQSDAMFLYGGIVLVWLALGAIYWISKKRPKLASWLFLLLLLATAVFSDTPYYVIQGRTMALFALPVTLASVLLSPFSSFIFAGLATVALVAVSLQVGIVPNPVFVVLYMVAIIMSVVMQNIDRLLAGWRRASSRLELFNRAGRLLGADLSAEQVMTNVVNEARDVAGAAYATVWWLDPEANQFVCRGLTSGMPEMLLGRRVAAHTGLLGRVLETGEGAVVDDLRQDDRVCPAVGHLTAEGLRSLLYLPLKVGDRTTGVLGLVGTSTGCFSPSDLSLLEPIATSAGVAIESAQLYEETDRLRQFNAGIVNGMQEGILMFDELGVITFVNRRMEEMLGYTRADLVGELASTVVASEEWKLNRTRPEQIAKGQYEVELRAADGQSVPVLMSVRPLEREGVFSGVLAAITDITALKEAEKELRRQAAVLREQNEELDAYAHTVAHDVKSPIVLAVGYADVLRMAWEELPREKIAAYLELISSTGLKACSIVDELLMFAEVRSGEAVRMPLGMDTIVASVLHRLEQMAAERDAHLEVPTDWPTVLGYGPWVEEVWVNYVSNALKYGGDNPVVELGWDNGANGDVRFWVRDSGPGLTPEEQDRLFRSFARLRAGKIDGHGLGLSIVLRIVQKLGGQVGVESAVGEGSRFYFTLPRAEDLAPGSEGGEMGQLPIVA